MCLNFRMPTCHLCYRRMSFRAIQWHLDILDNWLKRGRLKDGKARNMMFIVNSTISITAAQGCDDGAFNPCLPRFRIPQILFLSWQQHPPNSYPPINSPCQRYLSGGLTQSFSCSGACYSLYSPITLSTHVCILFLSISLSHVGLQLLAFSSPL